MTDDESAMIVIFVWASVPMGFTVWYDFFVLKFGKYEVYWECVGLCYIW